MDTWVLHGCEGSTCMRGFYMDERVLHGCERALVNRVLMNRWQSFIEPMRALADYDKCSTKNFSVNMTRALREHKGSKKTQELSHKQSRAPARRRRQQ